MNIVVITGASSGMGREFAMQLDRGLHSVDEFWLIARRGSRLKEIASGMQHTVKILPLDLTNEADMTVLTESLAEEKPVVRMLINCAGYGMMGDFTAVPIKEQTGEVDLNCRALLEVTYGCLQTPSDALVIDTGEFRRVMEKALRFTDHSAGEQCGIFAPAGIFRLRGDKIVRFELFQGASGRAEGTSDLCDGGLPWTG